MMAAASRRPVRGKAPREAAVPARTDAEQGFIRRVFTGEPHQPPAPRGADPRAVNRTLQSFHVRAIVGLGREGHALTKVGSDLCGVYQGFMMPSVRRSRSFRAALIGAVAFAALGGAAFERTLFPVHAIAASEPSAITAQPAAGPASFADIVDRVKPAVVSVKVKLSDVDQSRRGASAQVRRISRRTARSITSSAISDCPGATGDGEGMPHHHSTMAQGSGFFISSPTATSSPTITSSTTRPK